MDVERPNPMQPLPTHAPVRRIVVIAIVVVGLIAVGVFLFRVRGPKSSTQGTIPQPRTRVVQSTPPAVDPFPNDKDRDGLTADEEKKYGTSDLEFDTDHDGLSDRAEVKVWHTDPTKADTDGDGFSDGYEVVNGYNPNGPGKLKK